MKLTKTLFCIAALLLASSTLNADTVSFNATKSVDSIGINFALGKFDTGLGTLTGLSLTIHSVGEGAFLITNTSLTDPARVKNFSNSLFLTANDGGMADYTSSTLVETTTPATAGLGNLLPANTSRTYTIDAGQVLVNNIVLSINSSAWGNYQSAGGIGTASFDAATSPSITVVGAAYAANTNNATANTELTLAYTYTSGPVPAPEPSTVVVQLLIAAAGVWFFVRRRRSSV
jgi:hypothetical protein